MEVGLCELCHGLGLQRWLPSVKSHLLILTFFFFLAKNNIVYLQPLPSLPNIIPPCKV